MLIALFGAMLFLPAPRAEAAGCERHDQIDLELTFPWEEAPRDEALIAVGITASQERLIPRRCDSDGPGLSRKAAPEIIARVSTPAPLASLRPKAPWVAPTSSTPGPDPRVSRLDRPPRAS